MTSLDLEKKIISVDLQGNAKIKCTWSDGHEGVFDEEWLKERSFTEENINSRKSCLRNETVFINSEADIQRMNFYVSDKPNHVMMIMNMILILASFLGSC